MQDLLNLNCLRWRIGCSWTSEYIVTLTSLGTFSVSTKLRSSSPNAGFPDNTMTPDKWPLTYVAVFQQGLHHGLTCTATLACLTMTKSDGRCRDSYSWTCLGRFLYLNVHIFQSDIWLLEFALWHSEFDVPAPINAWVDEIFKSSSFFMYRSSN